MGSTLPIPGTPRPPSNDGSNMAPHTRRQTATYNNSPSCSRPASGHAEPPAKIRRTTHQEDGMTCPICYEPYGTVGDHKLVALRCGHLFGSRCIKNWLRGQMHCPKCRAVATLQDLRNIYTEKVVTVDDSVVAAMQSQLKQLEAEKARLQLELQTYRNCRPSTPCMGSSTNTLEPRAPSVVTASSRSTARRRNVRGSRRWTPLTPRPLQSQTASTTADAISANPQNRRRRRESAMTPPLPTNFNPEITTTRRRRRLLRVDNRTLAEQTVTSGSTEISAPRQRAIAIPRRRLPTNSRLSRSHR